MIKKITRLVWLSGIWFACGVCTVCFSGDVADKRIREKYLVSKEYGRLEDNAGKGTTVIIAAKDFERLKSWCGAAIEEKMDVIQISNFDKNGKAVGELVICGVKNR